MGAFSKPRRARRRRAPGGQEPDLCDFYDRYTAGLYRQALFTLDDPELAGQAVCDVLAGEYARPGTPASAGLDAGRRLAVSVYRRCQQLAASSAWHHRSAQERLVPAHADGAGAAALLTLNERAALALVLFGRLEYVQASRELAITPREMAGLLHDMLRRLAVSPSAPSSRMHSAPS